MDRNVLVIGGALLLCMAGPAQADKALAHSKSLGMSFTALGEPWCAATVQLRVDAEDAGKFSSSDYGTTLQKLGQVLSQECPQAGTLAITGIAAGRTVWSGSAAREGGWLAQQTTSQTTSQTPTQVVSAPARPATPDGSASVSTATTAVPAAIPAAVPAPSMPATAADGALVIAGWRPGGNVEVAENAGKMTEITSRETGCAIFTYLDVKPEFKPVFSTKQEYSCKNGYVQSTRPRQGERTDFYYAGQNRPFATVYGGWYKGYNLGSYNPKQIVSRYKVVASDQWNRSSEAERLLVWTGEDRDLRAHYFATYTYNTHHHQWRLDDRSPFTVLTDNEALKQNPDKTRLAESLAGMYQTFSGYKEGQFSAVQFVITDKMHETPNQAYELALKQANPDPAFYMAGRAVHHRGMPWAIEVGTDFTAKRAAFVEAERQRAEMERQREEARAEAERQRAEMERQRLAALRERHQESLDQQHALLAKASRYDQLRFYATLMLDGDRMNRAKVDFTSQRIYSLDPFSQAVAFTHPAQYTRLVKDGEVDVGSPMYLLVEADDGRIEKPYSMKVDYSETSQKIDGWMLIRVAPKFGFSFGDDGNPIFAVTVQEAVACKSELCLKELNAADMMKLWYGDDEINFVALGTD